MKSLARCDEKYVLVFSKESVILVQIVMKLEYCRQIFEKLSNFKFYENPSSGSRVVPCGRTDRHDEANSRYASKTIREI